MGAGRPNKPTALKELAGNPGKRPLNKQEPKMEVAAPERPRGLRDKASRRYWEKNLKRLLGMHVITAHDGILLAAMAHACARAEWAWEEIERRGYIVEITHKEYDKSGELKREWVEEKLNLALSVLASAEIALDKFGSKLGYSPVDRSKLKVEAGENKRDAMEEMLSRRTDKPGPLLVPELSDEDELTPPPAEPEPEDPAS